MKEVYIVFPDSSTSNNIYSFSEVFYMSGYLKEKNYEVYIKSISIKDSKKIQLLENKSVIGVFMWDNYDLIDWLEWFFNNIKSKKLILYGITIQNYQEELIEKYDIDAILIKSNNYNDILDGLLEQNNTDESFNKQLGFFDEELLSAYNIPIVPILGSRGCINNCTFCPINCSNNGKYITRKADSIFNDILVSLKHNKSIFYFVDSCFVSKDYNNKMRINDLCNMIIKSKLKISFYIETRADCIEEELFYNLKKAGLRRVLIGVENFNTEVLRRYNKNITTGNVLEAIKTLKKLNIGIELTFIMFDPFTSFFEIEENLAIIIEYDLHKYVPLKGIFRKLILFPTNNIIELDSLKCTNSCNNENLSNNCILDSYEYNIINEKVDVFEKRVNKLIDKYVTEEKLIIQHICSINDKKTEEHIMNKTFLKYIKEFVMEQNENYTLLETKIENYLESEKKKWINKL